MTHTMALSSALSSYLLVALAAGTLLSTEGPEISNSDGTKSEAGAVTVRSATPTKLVCPNSNPDHYPTTTWYMVSGNDGPKFQLYHIDQQGVVTKKEDRSDAFSRLRVTHNITDTDALMIYDETCNHIATYYCRRLGKLGQPTRVHKFYVANCTVLENRGPRSGPKTVHYAGTRYNSSPPAVVRFQSSAAPPHEALVTIRPSSTALPRDEGAATELEHAAPTRSRSTEPRSTALGHFEEPAIVPNDVVTTTSAGRSVHATARIPFTTPGASTTAASAIGEPPFSIAAPLKLVCPNSKPGLFMATGWYMVTERGKLFGLYRIDNKGVISKYRDGDRDNNTLSGIDVTLNVTSAGALLIYGDTCNHTATYRCIRRARVGRRNEEHSFSVANCTVLRQADVGVREQAASLDNTAMHLASRRVMLALGPVVWFISIY